MVNSSPSPDLELLKGDAMFDKSRLLPEDVMFEHVDEINRAVANVRLRLKDEIQTKRSAPKLDLFVDAERYLQAHVRRALMFLDGGKHSLDGSYGLVTLACARSLYESTACIYDFTRKFCDLIATGDVESADRLVHERSLAVKFKEYRPASIGYNLKPDSIMAFIDALEDEVPDARRAYEQLSEAVHPNALGTLLYFETADDGATAKYNSQPNPDGLYAVLVAAASLFSLIHQSMLGVESAYLKTMADELQERIEDYERRKVLGVTHRGKN
jgi:hypothetical protein